MRRFFLAPFLFATFFRKFYLVCQANLNSQSLARLDDAQRIWAVPALHGDVRRLTRLHDHIFKKFRFGDRLVYHGNYTGYSRDSRACVEEIITFRRLILSLPAVRTTDIVYLRGQQEEILDKLLQLPFAPDPVNVLLWMLGNGLSDTLYSYGLSPHDGIEAARAGVMGLTKWTGKIRAALRAHPGHEIFFNQLSRAAHTALDGAAPILFVHAGLNPDKPVEEQGDYFWWASQNFETIAAPYLPFQKVIRGYDPAHGGLKMNCLTATIDAGCGFGGPLACALFAQSGQVSDVIEI